MPVTPYTFNQDDTEKTPTVLPMPRDATTALPHYENKITGVMKAILVLVFLNGLLFGAMFLLIIMYLTKP